MRGKALPVHNTYASARNNPAYAGKRRWEVPACPACREQPRERGEKGNPAICTGKSWGTTPHTRGKDSIPSRFALQLSSFLSTSTFTLAHYREQPRIRGEKPQWLSICARALGATPHTRGKVTNLRNIIMTTRNNPAYAGKRLHNQQVYHTTIEFSFNFDFYLSAAPATETTLKFVTSLSNHPDTPHVLT